MNVKCISVLIALVCVITAGSVQTAIGAQFDYLEKSPSFVEYCIRNASYRYESGGDIARRSERGKPSLVKDLQQHIQTPSYWIIDRLNENILKDQSSASPYAISIYVDSCRIK